jgi:hypothetical protein
MGRWGTAGQHFKILNIIQFLNLKLKLKLYLKAGHWGCNLNFSMLANFLKISVFGFFANLNIDGDLYERCKSVLPNFTGEA